MGTPGDQPNTQHHLRQIITQPDDAPDQPSDQQDTSTMPNVLSLPIPILEPDNDIKPPIIADLAPSLIEIEPSISELGVDSDYIERLSESTRVVDVQLPGPSGLHLVRLSGNGNGKKGNGSVRKVGGGYQCGHCQKIFSNTSKLLKHQQTIHNTTTASSSSSNAPFKCDNCKKTFSSKFKLVRHSLIHSDRRPFSCTVCNRTFHRKDHLKNHCKVHDHAKELYVCGKLDCKKEYTSHLSYKKHLALHAAEEGNLDCQLCHKGFRSKDDVLMHLKVHAGSRPVKNPDEKKYRCDSCGRRFFTRKDVRRHEVVHTGMRDFLCQFCPERFGRKDHLIRHIKKLHYQQQQQQQLQQQQLLTPSTSSSSHSQPTIKLEHIPKEEKVEQLTHADYYDTGIDFLFGSTAAVDDEDARSGGMSSVAEFSGIVSGSGDSIDQFKHEPIDILEDLGSNVLDDITTSSSQPPLSDLAASSSSAASVSLVDDPSEFIQLLQQTTESTGKLPAFDKIFQQQKPLGD